MARSEDGCSALEEKVEQSWSAIFVNGHPKGSLLVRISNVEAGLDSYEKNTDAKLDDIKKSVDELPKKMLTWLLIIGALIGILQFIGPSLRQGRACAILLSPMKGHTMTLSSALTSTAKIAPQIKPQ